MTPQSIAEPSTAQFQHGFHRYFAATRPAFLFATLAACFLGLAGAAFYGVIVQIPTAMITVLLALLVHAGVNVLNDYFDALNGTDAANTERLYPFTGGSRFIQNGVLSLQQTLYFGYILLGLAILGGLWLVSQMGLGLLWIGLLGMLIGWAYSATPLRLNSRGLGELCVFIGFLCLAVGTDYVQRRLFSLQPLVVGVPYALLATNLLYINQFPDRKADALANKRNLVVRLPLRWAVWIYPSIAIIALVWLLIMVELYQLPIWALLSALPLLFSACATFLLVKFSAKPVHLLPAIRLTLAAMFSHALLLTLVLFWEML